MVLLYPLVCFPIIAIATIFLVYYYALPNTPWGVLVTVYFSWLAAFSICFILPLDIIKSTDHNALDLVWDILYWTSFFMCWLIIPLQQSYYESGEFTPKDKFKDSVKINILFYAVAGVLFVIFLIYLLITRGVSLGELVGFVMCLSNTWGLTLAVLMLGYGLVELPRYFWHRTNRIIRTKQLYFKIAILNEERIQVKTELAQAIRIVDKILDNNMDEFDNYGNNIELRRHAQVVRDRCPLIEDSNANDLSMFETHPIEKQINEKGLSKKILVKLHYQVIRGTKSKWRVESELQSRVEEAIALEDLIASTKVRNKFPRTNFRDKVIWQCKILGQPILYRILAVIFVLMSLMLIWSEVSLIAADSGIDLCPIGALHRSAQSDAIDFVVLMFPLTYLCCCVFYSMWQIHLPKYYQMHGNRRTDENSLLFNASYLLRLMAPLAYNYTYLARVSATSFQKIIGRMEVIPFFGSSFNTYFPAIILILSVVTLFNLYGRFLKLMGISHYDHRESTTNEEIEEGRFLLNRERRKINRKKGTLSRKKMHEIHRGVLLEP